MHPNPQLSQAKHSSSPQMVPSAFPRAREGCRPPLPSPLRSLRLGVSHLFPKHYLQKLPHLAPSHPSPPTSGDAPVKLDTGSQLP